MLRSIPVSVKYHGMPSGGIDGQYISHQSQSLNVYDVLASTVLFYAWCVLCNPTFVSTEKYRRIGTVSQRFCDSILPSGISRYRASSSSSSSSSSMLYYSVQQNAVEYKCGEEIAIKVIALTKAPVHCLSQVDSCMVLSR